MAMDHEFPELTQKQGNFVREFLIDRNATQAAIRAGYSENSAGVIGHENLTKPEIKKHLDIAIEERAERTKIDADFVLQGITRVTQRCEQAEPVLDREGNETGEYTFQAGAALKGYELLGRHLKMFTDKQEIAVTNLADVVAAVAGASLPVAQDGDDDETE